jgi:hypothetical protein
MEPLDLFLQEIKEHPAYPALKEKIEKNFPDIPEFDPQKDNVEEWKQKSGMKKGYTLCLALFNIRSSP